MDIPYHLPGTTEPDIIVRRSALGSISVLVNGQKAKRRGALKYDVPMPDGTITELRLGGQWSGLKATANGVETVLEPPVNPIFTILVFIPLVLIVIGGLIGGVIGVIASGINLALSRRPFGAPIKVVAMLGTVAVAAAVWFGVALTIAPLPKLAVGQCVNGIREGAELQASNYKGVDCGTSHDSEIVAIVQYTQAGAYPGQAALLSFAEPGCMAAFKTYVGIDFTLSELEMIGVTPNDVRWAKGDRDIDCAVIGPSGAKLTGSVKGTAR